MILPVQIGLTLSAGADGHIKGFSFDLLTIYKSRLKYSGTRALHDYFYSLSENQNVFTRVETAFNRLAGRRGGKKVWRMKMRLCDLLVTIFAGPGSGELFP